MPLKECNKATTLRFTLNYLRDKVYAVERKVLNLRTLGQPLIKSAEMRKILLFGRITGIIRPSVSKSWGGGTCNLGKSWYTKVAAIIQNGT